jgi:cytochrome c-type biogenesis protein CcsB
MLRSLLPLLVVLSLPAPLRAGPELDALRDIAIQDGGRLKPFDTFARETAKRVVGAKPFGFESVLGLDPVSWVVAMIASPDEWRTKPMFKVTHAGLRDAAGLPAGKNLYSFDELAGHEGFLKAAERVHEKQTRDKEAKLDPIEREISGLTETLIVVRGIFSGESLRIIPDPRDARATWYTLKDIEGDTEQPVERVKTLLASMVLAYRDGDAAGVGVAATALNHRLEALAPATYPLRKTLDLEVHYNRLKPYRLAWIFYLLGFLTLLASLSLGGRGAGRVGILFTVLGFACHIYGIVVRIMIAGRPPVTNMYESVIWVAFGAMLFALIFELVYKARYFALCASALAVLCLILADNVPILDGSIDPLVPVLRDNMWLTIHVLTITLGYAAFTLGMGLGHVILGLHFLAPTKAELQKNLALFLYRALQVGTLFLATGTMLGGVWASYSWGRFWGWDPKETWALIALLGYLAILHARVAGWIADFGTAIGSLVGYLGVLMAWYGVNFVLGTGLHSYGFGSGGYAYVGGFVAFEILVIIAAIVRRRREPPAFGGAPALQTAP